MLMITLEVVRSSRVKSGKMLAQREALKVQEYALRSNLRALKTDSVSCSSLNSYRYD